MTQLNAGRLRSIVTIQSRTTATSTRGQSTDVWSDLETRFAQVRMLSGSEREEARKIVENTTHEFILRKPRSYTLTTKHRIRYRSETYGIGAVIIEDDLHDDLRVLCSKGDG